jgi:GNAT superfamily N-acetyltransferase
VIEISGLAPEDRAEWEELFRGYNEFYGRTAPQELLDRAWLEFQAGIRMYALGAKLDGRLAGIAHFLIHPSTTTADVCYLQDLFTAPDARGHGVGRALIERVADWAREQGCVRLYWHTHESNATARKLYDQVADNDGFIVYRHSLQG